MTKSVHVEPGQWLLWTYQGKASLHRAGCSHLDRYSRVDKHVPGAKGIAVTDDVQTEVDDLVERGLPIRKAACLRDARTRSLKRPR